MNILILKSLHLFFVIAWFAGIFYLPRIFVYHAQLSQSSEDQATAAWFKIMARRLLYFITPFAIISLVLGVAIIYSYGMDWLKQSAWLHLKLTLVALLYLYHGYCFVLLKRFQQDRNQRSDKFYRIFNELPVLLLLAIVFLAVIKPF